MSILIFLSMRPRFLVAIYNLWYHVTEFANIKKNEAIET